MVFSPPLLPLIGVNPPRKEKDPFLVVVSTLFFPSPSLSSRGLIQLHGTDLGERPEGRGNERGGGPTENVLPTTFPFFLLFFSWLIPKGAFFFIFLPFFGSNGGRATFVAGSRHRNEEARRGRPVIFATFFYSFHFVFFL